MSVCRFDFFYFLDNSLICLKGCLLCVILHFLIFWFVTGEFLGYSFDDIAGNASPQRFFRKPKVGCLVEKKKQNFFFLTFSY